MYIGLDVGGTNLVAGLVDREGKILHKAACPVDRSWTAEELSARLARLARQALALEHARGVRRRTQRTGFALTVVLTVGLSAHAAETVTLHNALEAFTFRYPGHVHPVLFREEFHGKRVAEIHFGHTLEFSHFALRGSAGFLEVS